MNCDEARRCLDDLSDGPLDEIRAQALTAHLALCGACAKEAEAADELRRSVAELPAAVEPSRDLWPEIAARIESRKVVRGRFLRHALTAAAAAAVIIVTATTAYVIGSRQNVGPSSTVAGPAADRHDAVRASFTALGVTDFEQTRRQLLDALENRRDQLSPETLDLVMRNVELINDAMAKIAMALGDDPGNELLQRRLVHAYRRQIDLLEQAAVLPSDV
jgi:anti-sigma factor RsiW